MAPCPSLHSLGRSVRSIGGRARAASRREEGGERQGSAAGRGRKRGKARGPEPGPTGARLLHDKRPHGDDRRPRALAGSALDLMSEKEDRM